MKTIQEIKRNITKINKYCETNRAAIIDYMQANNLTIEDFCLSVGLDYSLLNDTLYNTLQTLLSDDTTRIYCNPGATDLVHDEISLYSKKTGINIGYLENIIKVVWDKNDSDSLYQKSDREFMAIKKEDDVNIIIHFALQTVALNKLAFERILTNKYPLDHMQIDISFAKYLSDGAIIEEKNNRVVIEKEMIARDLEKILGLLYNFNYDIAVAILKRYPASDKKISDVVDMNNFFNR